MTIYNLFIIYFIGFTPLVGEIFPQTPEKSERKFKNLLSEQRHSGLKYLYLLLLIYVLK